MSKDVRLSSFMAVVPADSDAWPEPGLLPWRRPGAGVGCRWCGCMVLLAQVWKKGGDLRREVGSCALRWRRSSPQSLTCANTPRHLRQGGEAPSLAPYHGQHNDYHPDQCYHCCHCCHCYHCYRTEVNRHQTFPSQNRHSGMTRNLTSATTPVKERLYVQDMFLCE